MDSRRNRMTYSVEYSLKGGSWCVNSGEVFQSTSSECFSSKKEALSRVRELARGQSAEIVIRDQDGSTMKESL